jgi:hypothetical protein
VSDYPTSTVCPQCGSTEYTTRRAEKFVSFVNDRVCQSCNTRYSPPTPRWAGVVFIFIGLVLGIAGIYSIILRIQSGNPLGFPAMLIEGFLGFIGLIAIGVGIKTIVSKKKT